MSLRQYPEYKGSRVEWLREVPAHWQTPPLYLRYSADLGKMLDSSRVTGDWHVPYLRNVDIQWGAINFNDLPEMDIEPSEYGRYTVTAGDLLVCEGGEVGRAAIVPDVGGIVGYQKALHRLRALTRDEHPAFMYYVMVWAAGYGVFNQSGLSTIAHLTGEQLRKYRFPKPPLTEQTAIAAFLDRETAKIDALIAEQEKLIALLAEKRQATISHAVTKGLNPDAPMKDSGVAWLGEVPAHWRVGKIQNFARRESGHTPSRQHPEWWENCTIPWFSLADVWQLRTGNVKYVYETKELVSELGLANSSARLLPAGTVMLSRTASVGYSAIMGCAMATTQDFINWVCKSELAPEFLLYVLRGMKSEFDRLMMGSTHQTIYMPDVARLMMGLPSPEEQAAIVAFLDAETSRLDNLTVESTRAIDLLKERRRALISAAVTGKIDVRDTRPM